MQHKKGMTVLLFLLILGYADAADLRVITTDGETRSFAIDSIKSITFAQGRTAALIIASRNHDSADYALTKIAKVVFTEPASIVHGPIAPLPSAFILHQNYPNPFNPETTIAFELSSPGWVAVRVFNINGQAVHTLVEGLFSEGAHQVRWNGCDSRGYAVSAGVYLYEMKNGASVQIKKCLLIE